MGLELELDDDDNGEDEEEDEDDEERRQFRRMPATRQSNVSVSTPTKPATLSVFFLLLPSSLTTDYCVTKRRSLRGRVQVQV